MKTRTLSIQGMTCDHCVMSVKKELAKVSTVKEIAIGRAVVEVDETIVSEKELSEAVAEAGYTATSIA